MRSAATPEPVSSASPTRAVRGDFLRALLLAGLAAAVLGVVAADLTTGPMPLSWVETVRALAGSHENGDAVLVVRHARLPRVLLAVTVGAALAIAGLVMQTVGRNALATPSVLGIGGGAHLGAILAILTVPRLGEWTYLGASIAGAGASALVVLSAGFAVRGRMERDRLIIAGTLVSSVTGSLVVLLLFVHNMHNAMLAWTIGRLVHVDPAQVQLLLPVLVSGGALAVAIAARLEVLRLDETTATGLGARPGRLRGVAIVLVVVLAGASVAAAGPIPYVGLVVPHVITRARVSAPVVRLIACGLGGALLTTTADWLSKVTSDRAIVPLGVFTMALGATFFLAAAISSRRRDP